ncbi:MAG: DUF5103 domain-containing protein [Cyclobacteriaceae bacterium]|nr:DUF5103 domain-containing protein [Cyclobacteriaceae bacterium]
MNFRKSTFFSYSFLAIISCFHLTAFAQSNNKKLEFIDKIYEEHIKTAYLFQGENAQAAPLAPATIALSQQVPLTLKFDELYTDNADYYKARILHCNMNWQQSHVSEMQYLFEFNEFSIDEFDFSIATKTPYTHFTFVVPSVKLPGNYLLVVYREGNKDDVIITKRFVVFDPKVEVLADIARSAGVVERQMNQQIQFAIDYSTFPISNPYLDVKVIIKQNQRWDNAIYNLAPTSIKEDVSIMEYRHFNLENNFKAGNEFRFFDIRTIHYGGRNVDKTNISETRIDAYLYYDKSRGTEPYTYTDDLNGAYLIANSEGRNNLLEADYVTVHFLLDMASKHAEDIYISGKLTNWSFDESNRMKFVDVSGLYTGQLLLKQGLYDYSYYMPANKENPNLPEGNHFETNNEYEILVYYNDHKINADLVIGYLRLN